MTSAPTDICVCGIDRDQHIKTVGHGFVLDEVTARVEPLAQALYETENPSSAYPWREMEGSFAKAPYRDRARRIIRTLHYLGHGIK